MNNMLQSKIRNWLMQICNSEKITKTEIASLAGIDRSTTNDFINGNQGLDMKNGQLITEIAYALEDHFKYSLSPSRVYVLMCDNVCLRHLVIGLANLFTEETGKNISIMPVYQNICRSLRSEHFIDILATSEKDFFDSFGNDYSKMPQIFKRLSWIGIKRKLYSLYGNGSIKTAIEKGRLEKFKRK